MRGCSADGVVKEFLGGAVDGRRPRSGSKGLVIMFLHREIAVRGPTLPCGFCFELASARAERF